ncbi:TIR domain-containing protein [Bacillus sp. CH126_4D]|uniref:toll/interleukin-1 receptor domain-containing protein n=1 Tax=unclassified Bacillus (in: firmicutes) TaxID=185979 RepID=UPI00124DDEEB|nr:MULTISPECIES: toll/interleukin-1 receptor domain-containing protein [unclassified Bacillus (in: firmicutes)]KAB2460942.1 TIR domain-containing protein [Bacillus sp. CH140a_4T]KAB2475024.1 TIR domain-containing protein [Bacillus sp. CH126_4D]
MHNSPEKVFVSYSWDSEEHKLWVLELVRKLRSEGYDANFDRGITSTSTVNLNQMMVEHMRDDDYIIMVLTEKYTVKADGFAGGVGFETILSLPIIQQHLDKLIILTRQPAVLQKVIPFHLQGINYIDFSNSAEFDNKFEELIYRLQKVPMFDLGPIGEKKLRKPKAQDNSTGPVLNDVTVPRLSPPTDLEKNYFIEENFNLIINGLDDILNILQSQNSTFIYQKKNITNDKVIYSFYLNGQNYGNLKIWLGSLFSSIKQIQFSVGRYVDSSNDNSMNGSVNVEIDQEYNLSLSMPMNMFSPNTKSMKYAEVVKSLYEQHILPYLR